MLLVKGVHIDDTQQIWPCNQENNKRTVCQSYCSTVCIVLNIPTWILVLKRKKRKEQHVVSYSSTRQSHMILLDDNHTMNMFTRLSSLSFSCCRLFVIDMPMSSVDDYRQHKIYRQYYHRCDNRVSITSMRTHLSLLLTTLDIENDEEENTYRSNIVEICSMSSSKSMTFTRHIDE
jgi:hypothetical protein